MSKRTETKYFVSGRIEHTHPFPFQDVGHGVMIPGCHCDGIEYETDGSPINSFIAHAMGQRVITEVSRHNPGKPYSERVFYTKHYIKPDGDKIKSKGLSVCTIGAFNIMLKGFKGSFELQVAS